MTSRSPSPANCVSRCHTSPPALSTVSSTACEGQLIQSYCIDITILVMGSHDASFCTDTCPISIGSRSLIDCGVEVRDM